jgi:hypothetical protein
LENPFFFAFPLSTQLFPAFASSLVDDCPTRFGGHSLTEAMLHFSPSIIRLERSFHFAPLGKSLKQMIF